MYRNKLSVFSMYNPYSNSYVVNSGENGLQYINLPSDISEYISLSSDTATKKQNMISTSLTNLETTSGYIKTQEVVNTNYSLYLFLIIITLLIIGVITTVASIHEL